MEAKICCAYNVTRGCRINSTVTVADSAREPLKVLKVLVEGLARDSRSSLWLTPLVYPPQLTRLFPFDLAYLDRDLRVLEAMALRPEVPTPQFHAGVASALILPFNSLQSSGTVAGDQILVCAEDEIELRLAEIARPVIAESVADVADAPSAAASLPFTALPKLPLHPFPSPQVSVQTTATAIPQGTGFTLGMASSWQISNSTMAAAVLEPAEVRVEAVREEDAVERLAAVGLAEAESPEAPSEAAEPEAIVVAPATVAVEPEALEEKPRAVEEGGRVEEPVSSVSSETAQAVARAGAQAFAHEAGKDALTPQRKEPAKNLPMAAAASAKADVTTLKKKSAETKKKGPKEPLGTLVKRWLNCPDPLPERRSIIRLVSRELVAYVAEREKTTPCAVRDVSPTGLYLRTQERWNPGDVVSLMLQRKDAPEDNREKRVRIEVRVVRCDEGGAGLEWMWPDDVEFEPWKRVHTKRSDETDADYFLRELRLTSALGFLRQICPAATEEIRLALHKRLSNKRVASAVEIVLKAREMQERLEPRTEMQAHPDMVRRILENGSWTEDDWIRQWWAGLLVSSCSTDARDTSNAVFIDMLAKLTPVHLRVLEFVCGKATELIAAGEPAATLNLYCTGEELIEAVGSHSLARIQQTMGQLSSLGLLAENNKPSYVAVTDKVKSRTVPTQLALTMHARCNGHR